MLTGKSTRSSDIQKGIQPVKGEPPKASQGFWLVAGGYANPASIMLDPA